MPTATRVLRYAILLLAAALLLILAACGNRTRCDGRADLSEEDLLDCVTLEGASAHLFALQEIADRNDGNRAAGTRGYEESVAYVVQTLRDAGYETELNTFEYRYEPPNLLQQAAPAGEFYTTARVSGSGYGRVSGPVLAVDLALGEEPWPADPRESTSACEEEDFAGLDFSGDGDIALVEGGACLSSVKAVLAQEAGAEAMIILIKDGIFIDPLMTVDRVSHMPDGSASTVTIPVVAVAMAHGAALSQPGSEVTLQVPEPRVLVDNSVLAQLPGSEEGRVVMAGAHLDSAPTAPGISDNGTGSAALLETAVQMAGMQPHNTVRFAWWGAEEAGLIGSSAYVDGLTEAEKAGIAMYLNFDMIGSPNPATFIYDGNNPGRGGEGEGAQRSAEIEQLFESYFADHDQPFETTDMGRGSDFLPFKEAGLPVGAIFTGADKKMTEEQAALFGGEADEAFDHCYHKPCDTVDNIDMNAFEINSDAAAYAVYHCAMMEAW